MKGLLGNLRSVKHMKQNRAVTDVRANLKAKSKKYFENVSVIIFSTSPD